MKIFVDYDTTLVNLIDPWVAWINDRYNVSITTHDINRWYFLGEVFGREADDFWRSEKYNHYTDKDILQPFEGAINFFHTLEEKYGKENVFIISSTRDHHKDEKIKHAKYYFGINDNQFIPVNKEKYNITKNGILIDDYPLQVLEHVYNNNEYGFIFNYENRFGWTRKCNYNYDVTLHSFANIFDDKKIFYVSSYSEIITILNKHNKGAFNERI